MYTQKAASFALGLQKSPFVLKNAHILNVFTEEWLLGDIAVHDGIIVGVGCYTGEQEIDLDGAYVVPGFIDAHLHLESTLLNPTQLISQAVLRGTTTFIVDPHEAANVAGLDGIRYIIRDAAKCEANVHVMMPSCVPSLPFEKNGAVLHAEQMREMMDDAHILGLGEVMDVPSVLNCEPKMMEKLSLFRDYGRIMDGHGGSLDEKSSCCCRLAGIRTDHECTTYEDAVRETRNGIQILIREGTAARNLTAIVKGIIENQIPVDCFSFCTDDKHIEDIIENGHISHNIRKAIALGLTPEKAYKMASYNTARCYGLSDLGAVCPGFQADLVILNDITQVDIKAVYHKGKLITESPVVPSLVPSSLKDTVHISYPGKSVFKMPVCEELQPVIHVIPGEILTDFSIEQVPVRNGEFVPNQIYQKILVFERHHSTGMVGRGIIKGFSLTGGALASTVGHDSHNLIVIGDDDESMEQALLELIRCHGGYTVIRKGEQPLTQPLEIMGLMTETEYPKVTLRLKQMIAAARAMGIPKDIDPFITMSFLSLPVIPKVRITPMGIYHVENNCWYQLEENSKDEKTSY